MDPDLDSTFDDKNSNFTVEKMKKKNLFVDLHEGLQATGEALSS
jgi:hypothetical protein